MDLAVEQFHIGISTFQQQLDAIADKVNAERATLKSKAEQLELERQNFEEEKERVAAVGMQLGTCLGQGSTWVAGADMHSLP